ncbi:MAG TPA: CHAP domain-containing protein [Chloroflexota bacterium]|nr:CHAP domain-containing protein [Chloroflexota bacterium]
MGFTQVGSGPAGCLCLGWLEDSLGFGGRYRGAGYGSDDEALHTWQGLGFGTSSPQAGDLVFFAPAGSNGGAGHVGQLTGSDAFTSLWCDGRVMDGPVSEFAANNGTSVSGYVSGAALGVAGASASLPGISLPALPNPASIHGAAAPWIPLGLLAIIFAVAYDELSG